MLPEFEWCNDRAFGICLKSRQWTILQTLTDWTFLFLGPFFETEEFLWSYLKQFLLVFL
jgi:hypothetical protein